MLLQECLNFANFVGKRPEKAQFPGCLMKQETVFPFYVVYQAVMRKFTLAKQPVYITNYNIALSCQLRLEYCDLTYIYHHILGNHNPNNSAMSVDSKHNCRANLKD